MAESSLKERELRANQRLADAKKCLEDDSHQKMKEHGENLAWKHHNNLEQQQKCFKGKLAKQERQIQALKI